MYVVGVILYRNLPSSGAIAGIVVATVLALVFLVVAATALLVILILVRRERRTHPEYSWFEGVKVVLDVSYTVVLASYLVHKWWHFHSFIIIYGAEMKQIVQHSLF